jgi:hypothetical protein
VDATTSITDTGVHLVRAGSAQYQSCVELVRQKYWQRYGAVVDPQPDLFVVASDDAQTLGVAGLTVAEGRRLLSENYLDVPVEQACAAIRGAGVPDRRLIVEMGPMVSFRAGCGLLLMRRLPGVVVHLGHLFLISTLTQRLHEIARAAGWDFRTLANARRADLAGVHPADWGTYYATRPRTGLLHCGQYKEHTYALA